MVDQPNFMMMQYPENDRSSGNFAFRPIFEEILSVISLSFRELCLKNFFMRGTYLAVNISVYPALGTCHHYDEIETQLRLLAIYGDLLYKDFTQTV